ncbi:hypothetical protein O1L60_38440 [Streptomyces diastatochromogenes]|nr:hypothetical protein [Streptomyces diastatochromogenes]
MSDESFDWRRVGALRGRYEEALFLLEEATFGRPGGVVPLWQLRQLAAPDGAPDYGLLVAGPSYLDDRWLGVMTARGVGRKTAERPRTPCAGSRCPAWR